MLTRETCEQIYATAMDILEQMRISHSLEPACEEYFVGVAANPTSLADVFGRFITSAQNAVYRSTTIKLEGKEGNGDKIRSVIGDYRKPTFDLMRVACMDEGDLYAQLSERCGFEPTGSPRSVWRIWSCSVIDSARFLSTFSGLEDFQGFVASFQYNAATKAALPLYLAQKIRGMGFALSCDALKELGYVGYPKPDVHMKGILSGLGFCGEDDMEVFETLVGMADTLGITPYRLDKVLWLVSSGNFYLEDVQVQGRKQELIAAVHDALAARR
ncbi:hypothetical protein H6A22_09815 [Collinsella intestinalis]|nr:hypothetical protein [Collinsella intestinalis]